MPIISYYHVASEGEEKRGIWRSDSVGKREEETRTQREKRKQKEVGRCWRKHFPTL